jgi:hypothetical protein
MYRTSTSKHHGVSTLHLHTIKSIEAWTSGIWTIEKVVGSTTVLRSKGESRGEAKLKEEEEGSRTYR